MNANARTMLEALRNSSNECTRDNAICILENKGTVFSGGRRAEELAVAGQLGDFLKAVMGGDFLEAYGRADFGNQRALRRILAPDNDRF